jgi:hypothetical protein
MSGGLNGLIVVWIVRDDRAMRSAGTQGNALTVAVKLPKKHFIVNFVSIEDSSDGTLAKPIFFPRRGENIQRET